MLNFFGVLTIAECMYEFYVANLDFGQYIFFLWVFLGIPLE